MVPIRIGFCFDLSVVVQQNQMSVMISPPRKKWAPRCPRCEMHLQLCICDQMPSIELKSWVSVVMHVREKNLATNSARLMQRILRNSDLVKHGEPGKNLSDLKAALLPLKGLPVILFPADESETLTEGSFVTDVPVHLLVPDGNWSNGRKLFNRLRGMFPEARCVKLDPRVLEHGSQYRLRASLRPEAFSTFEAIASALKLLEPLSPEVHQQMMAIFRLKVERTLWTRGR